MALPVFKTACRAAGPSEVGSTPTRFRQDGARCLRIPVALAWSILILTFVTAGILRQFHDRIPLAPHTTPLLGSLLFAAIVLLLLALPWSLLLGVWPIAQALPIVGAGIVLLGVTVNGWILLLLVKGVRTFHRRR